MTPTMKYNVALADKSFIEDEIRERLNTIFNEYQEKHGIAIDSIHINTKLDTDDNRSFIFVSGVSINLNDKPFLLENLK